MAFRLQRKRPINHPLWFATIVEFLSYVYSFNAVFNGTLRGHEYDLKDTFGKVAVPLTLLQVFVVVISIFNTLLLFSYAWRRSYGYGRQWRNRCRAHICGAFSVTFFVAFLVTTVLWPFHFGQVGFFFCLAFKSFLFLFFLFWRRENLIEQYIDEMTHVNGASCVMISTQNLRDLYKVYECDNEFVTYADSFGLLCVKPYLRGIRQAEYYHLHKWANQLAHFVDKGGSRDVLCDVIKDMHSRADFLNISKVQQRRYQQLAGLHSVIQVDPVHMGVPAKSMVRDASYLVHAGGKLEDIVMV